MAVPFLLSLSILCLTLGKPKNKFRRRFAGLNSFHDTFSPGSHSYVSGVRWIGFGLEGDLIQSRQGFNLGKVLTILTFSSFRGGNKVWASAKLPFWFGNRDRGCPRNL
jgi:hypothetical protein